MFLPRACMVMRLPQSLTGEPSFPISSTEVPYSPVFKSQLPEETARD